MAQKGVRRKAKGTKAKKTSPGRTVETVTPTAVGNQQPLALLLPDDSNENTP